MFKKRTSISLVYFLLADPPSVARAKKKNKKKNKNKIKKKINKRKKEKKMLIMKLTLYFLYVPADLSVYSST